MVTDGQTDGQTDRQTDRQTGKQKGHFPSFSWPQKDVEWPYWTKWWPSKDFVALDGHVLLGPHRAILGQKKINFIVLHI